MDLQEKAYWLDRAEAEIALAHQAQHEKAARAHYFLAGVYLDRAHRDPEATVAEPEMQAA